MELNNMYMILFLAAFGIFLLLSLIIPLLLKFQQKKNVGVYQYKEVEFAFADSPRSQHVPNVVYEYAQPASYIRPEPVVPNKNRTMEISTKEGRLTGEYSGSGSKMLSSRPRYEVVRTSAIYRPRI